LLLFKYFQLDNCAQTLLKDENMNKVYLIVAMISATLPSLSLAQDAPSAEATPAVEAQQALVATQAVNPLLLLGGLLAIGVALSGSSSSNTTTTTTTN
jgi:hypothetical protein